jgi:hypothetical protein
MLGDYRVTAHLVASHVWLSSTELASSLLQIQRSGFDSWRYHIFWEVVGLERGVISLVSTAEVLTE